MICDYIDEKESKNDHQFEKQKQSLIYSLNAVGLNEGEWGSVLSLECAAATAIFFSGICFLFWFLGNQEVGEVFREVLKQTTDNFFDQVVDQNQD